MLGGYPPHLQQTLWINFQVKGSVAKSIYISKTKWEKRLLILLFIIIILLLFFFRLMRTKPTYDWQSMAKRSRWKQTKISWNAIFLHFSRPYFCLRSITVTRNTAIFLKLATRAPGKIVPQRGWVINSEEKNRIFIIPRKKKKKEFLEQVRDEGF